jgi:predicted GNAT family acetyltransferase
MSRAGGRRPEGLQEAGVSAHETVDGSVSVRDNPEAHRYEVTVDGRVAGFVLYRRRHPRQTVLVHTEIDEAFEGEGLGSVLAAGALDDIRVNAGSVVPACPFIARFIARHHEYMDLVVDDSTPG